MRKEQNFVTILSSYWVITKFNGNETHWSAGMFLSMLDCLYNNVGAKWYTLPIEELSSTDWIVPDVSKHGDGRGVVYRIIRSDSKPDLPVDDWPSGRVFDLRDLQLYAESMKGRQPVRPGFKPMQTKLVFK